VFWSRKIEKKGHGKKKQQQQRQQNQRRRRNTVWHEIFAVSILFEFCGFFFHDPQNYADTKIFSAQIYSTGEIIMQTAHVESCFVQKQNSRDVHQVVP